MNLNIFKVANKTFHAHIYIDQSVFCKFAAFGVQGIFSPSCNLNTNLYIDIDILTIVDVALVNVKRDWLRNSGVSYGLNGQYFFKLLLNLEGCYQFSFLRQTLS